MRAEAATGGDASMRALVVGCGRIGAAWDSPGDSMVMTHAHAYSRHPRIGALAFVDLDPEAARRAAETWGGKAFTDLETAIAEYRPDLASVCVPDEAHHEALDRLIGCGARLILAEKPLTTRLEDSAGVVRKARERGVLVNVNYGRRFDPEVAALRAAIRRGDHGRPLNAVAYYTKGLLHNGSHLVDLLRHLFGEVVSARPLHARAGCGVADPTLDCWLALRECPSAHIVGLEEERYSIIELDLLFEGGRVRFTRFGFQVENQPVRQDPIYPGYRDLAPPEARETGFASAMTRYLEDSLHALDAGSPLTCPAEDAWLTQKACMSILEIYQKESRSV
jgi:predicted dehydrogenase